MLGRSLRLRRLGVLVLAAMMSLSGAIPQAVAREMPVSPPGVTGNSAPVEAPDAAIDEPAYELTFPDAPAAEPAPGVEITALRTATSRTFETSDGEMVTELFSEPVFYQPAANGAFQPIELGYDRDARRRSLHARRDDNHDPR